MLFRKRSLKKAGVLYGAGFGLGMSAPAIQELRAAFFDGETDLTK